MLECESIDEMLTRFITITNGPVSLGKPISNDQKVWKILKTLFISWEVKTITLRELNGKENIDFIAFVGNLKTHKMEMKAREHREPYKKIGVAFKSL